ncbi:MAG: hypothetical protein A2X59_13415 [Nitrospirae bacterium GWC2_42_7]|nr:MAG: hypothetical protein A2X59_13415 [Nitrospirae bacterium GWC2_42_7]
MKFEEYATRILQSTEESYVGLELDLRFDMIEFLRNKLSGEGWTQAILAKKLKMKPSQLNRILKAESNFTCETIARIYHVFGCRPTIKEKHKIPDAVSEPIRYTKQAVLSEPSRYMVI